MTNTNDERTALDYIEQQRAKDKLAYILSTLTTDNAPRTAPVARAIFTLLVDCGELEWNVAVAHGHQQSDIMIKSVESWIHQAVQCGVLIINGEYRSYFNRKHHQRFVTDTRTVKLGPNAPDVI